MNILKSAAGVAGVLVVLGVFAAASSVVRGALPAPEVERRTAQVQRVIDGDTFVIAGGARIRVRNFDTPELRSYDCPEEKIAAQGARRAARALLTRRTVQLRVTDKDRYGRLVADVALLETDGRARDYVDIMVASGHGARWRYGYEPQPRWCPDPSRTALLD